MPTILHKRFAYNIVKNIDAQFDTIGLKTGKIG
jgi:hypothetical protein